MNEDQKKEATPADEQDQQQDQSEHRFHKSNPTGKTDIRYFAMVAQGPGAARGAKSGAFRTPVPARWRRLILVFREFSGKVGGEMERRSRS